MFFNGCLALVFTFFRRFSNVRFLFNVFLRFAYIEQFGAPEPGLQVQTDPLPAPAGVHVGISGAGWGSLSEPFETHAEPI